MPADRSESAAHLEQFAREAALSLVAALLTTLALLLGPIVPAVLFLGFVVASLRGAWLALRVRHFGRDGRS